MAEEVEATEQETTFAPPEEGRNGSGPGFILGLVLGMIAGAGTATLFAPSTGDELRHRISEEAGPILKSTEDEGGPEGAGLQTAKERLLAVMSRVRSRVREASEEAGEAAREAEEQSRARYAELTQREEKQP